MTVARLASVALLAIGLAAGTFYDRPRVNPVLKIGDYRVLAADFHLHSSTWSDGTLTPWGLVLEAERQGLDAIAITGHNQIWDGKLARWFAERVGGPTVLPGQEIMAPAHHVIAIGISKTVNWRQDVAAEINEVHRQGGIAIAPHPVLSYWPAFDQAALRRLDGAEICHPLIFGRPARQHELEEFAKRAPMAAIGSSDFHGIGRMGACRTYVFARANTAQAILDALRAHRTVVYGPEGKAYGDASLVHLAADHPELREAAVTDPPVVPLDRISRLCGVLGLFGLFFSGVHSRYRG